MCVCEGHIAERVSTEGLLIEVKVKVRVLYYLLFKLAIGLWALLPSS